MIRTTTAKTLFKFDDEFYSDLSAITVNSYEKGEAYYVGIGADDIIMTSIANKILQESNIKTIESPKGVEVVERVLENKKYYFVMNHNGKTIDFGNINLKPYESKILNGEDLYI